MVWKIRSKSAFIFEKGTHRYITGKFKMVNSHMMHETPLILVRTDRYSPVRIAHNYRNISRACKQFLLGDSYAEQLLILMLRSEFRWPIDKIESPIENYKPIVN
jgi:hypothetical protein